MFVFSGQRTSVPSTLAIFCQQRMRSLKRFQKLKTPQLYETELTKYLAWSLIMCYITNLKLSAASIKRKYCFYNNDKF